MEIFEFDCDVRFEALLDIYSQVKKIKNSRAEDIAQYRILAENTELDLPTILNCCDNYERSLLIECYTFAEQLFKNFYYELLDFERNNNKYLRLFIQRKIPRDKFSPDVFFANIEGSIRSHILHGFKFILKDQNHEIKVYDEMIKSRHRYAHSGVYDFDFNNFEDVVKVLDYIRFELELITNKWNNANRDEFGKDIKDLVRLLNKCPDVEEKYIKNIRPKLKCIKSESIAFLKSEHQTAYTEDTIKEML